MVGIFNGILIAGTGVAPRGRREALRQMGEMLRQQRLLRGLRQRDLAQKVGVSQELISAYERARVDRPDPDVLARIEKVLSLAPGTLSSLVYGPEPGMITEVVIGGHRHQIDAETHRVIDLMGSLRTPEARRRVREIIETYVAGMQQKEREHDQP